MPTILLNPTNLQPTDIGLMWAAYFNRKRGITINLTHKLALQKSTSDADYYYVYSRTDHLGRGTGYDVYKGSGILIANKKTKEITFKRKVNFVFMEPRQQDEERFIEDTNLATKVPYMRYKIIKKVPLGYECKAKNLGKKYIHPKADDLLEKVNTAIKLIRALQAVHDLGITHRDVKPENFIINRKGAIKAIDFNLARKSNILDDKPDVGTLMYMSPDMLSQRRTALENTTLSDTYSLGLMLLELFGGTGRTSNIIEIKRCWERHVDQFDLNSLFSTNSDDIPDEYRYRLRHLITGMLRFFPQGRMTLDEALVRFLDIKHDILLSALPQTQKDARKAALKVGAQTHRELSKVKYLAEGSVDKLQTIIFDNLEKLGDTDSNPELIKCFIKECGVKAFTDSDTKQQIKVVTTQILDGFKYNVNKLLDLHDTLTTLKTITKNSGTSEEKTINALLNEANSLLRHTAKCTHKLDGIKAYNDKYGHDVIHLLNDVTSIRNIITPSNKPIVTLLDHLSTKPLNNSTSLKNKVRKAIQTYLKENLTVKNIKNNARAASDNRITTVNEIMALLNGNSDNLERDIKAKLNAMKFGLFGSYGSRLYQLVDKAIYDDKLANEKLSMRNSLFNR